jgi:hypothetical protein
VASLRPHSNVGYAIAISVSWLLAEVSLTDRVVPPTELLVAAVLDRTCLT